MAGRDNVAGYESLAILGRPRSKRRVRGAAAVAACALLLCGCSRERPSPVLGPAPTLVVVTATPGPPAIPTPGIEQRYVVRDGDTLSAIAARFGVPEDAILAANGISNPDKLYVGQELLIPAPQP